jgi:Zn-dependent M28 family amino/carboxypeptidase
LPAALEAHVRMLAETLTPRDWTRTDNLDRAAEYVARQWIAAGGRVTEQTYTAAAGRRYRNVIASLGPEDGERVIVGAHYDSFRGYPAADDNASGVAALIELGRLLGKTRTLAVRVDLVAFTLEEPPAAWTDWMGSRVHAASLHQSGVRVRAMIALDMIGYFVDADDSQRLPHPALGLFYPTTGNFIAVVGRLGDARLVRRVKAAMRGATDLPVHSMNGPTWIPGIAFSDHSSYWDYGYPAILVTDTAFYRNPHYHTPTDAPDTLDYRRMTKVVHGLYGTVRALTE